MNIIWASTRHHFKNHLLKDASFQIRFHFIIVVRPRNPSAAKICFQFRSIRLGACAEKLLFWPFLPLHLPLGRFKKKQPRPLPLHPFLKFLKPHCVFSTTLLLYSGMFFERQEERQSQRSSQADSFFSWKHEKFHIFSWGGFQGKSDTFQCKSSGEEEGEKNNPLIELWKATPCAIIASLWSVWVLEL